MSSYSLFRNFKWGTKPYSCALTKVIPLEKLESFAVQHYQRYDKVDVDVDVEFSLYQAHKLTQRGISYKDPKHSIPMPHCATPSQVNISSSDVQVILKKI